MESFQTMLRLQAILLIYMLLGVYVRKRNIVPAESRPHFTDFLVQITLPCMVFNSFNRDFTPSQLITACQVLFCAFLVCLFSFLLGKILYRNTAPARRSVMRYGTLISNGAFAGLPQVQGIYGPLGLFYGSIYLIPSRIFMWSAGTSMFVQADRKARIINILKNPGIIAVLLGLPRMLLQIPLPVAVDTALQAVGDCTNPLSMMVIGIILADVSIRDVIERDVLYLTAVRLLLIPAVLLAVMRLLHADPVLTGVSVILTAMPVGATTQVLAQKYGADHVLASKCVLTSTILPLFTIPVMSIFLR